MISLLILFTNFNILMGGDAAAALWVCKIGTSLPRSYNVEVRTLRLHFVDISSHNKFINNLYRCTQNIVGNKSIVEFDKTTNTLVFYHCADSASHKYRYYIIMTFADGRFCSCVCVFTDLTLYQTFMPIRCDILS